MRVVFQNALVTPALMSRSAMLRLLSCVLWTLTVAGCEAPNVFRSEPVEHPHATLAAENPPGWHGFMGLGRKVSPRFINHQPTAFWRTGDHFRLPPGQTVVDVVDSRAPYGFEPMRFNAVMGCHYILRPTRIGSRDAATLCERAPGRLTERVIATALRDAQ